MKKILLLLFPLLTIFSFFKLNGQNDAVFASVPVVDGKVVFQQFIPNADGTDASRQYAKLQKWGREKHQGNPLLSSIRFDDKTRKVTISSGERFRVPAVAGDVILRYRFDVSVTNAGSMLVVRDIGFQNEQPDSKSVIPETYAAEEMITDQAINVSDGKQELRLHARKATLGFLNGLYAELSSL